MRNHTGNTQTDAILEEVRQMIAEVSKRKTLYYGKKGIHNWIYLMVTHYLPVGSHSSWIPGRDAPDGWIYFILHDDVVIYIGRAACLKNRLARHHVYDKSRHALIFYYVGGQIVEAEALAINHFTPPLNYNGKLQQDYKNYIYNTAV